MISSNNTPDGLSKCYECGGAHVATKVEPRRMRLAGDWSITVEDTIVSRCAACGEESLGYQSAGMLMKAIANAVIKKQKRLAGPEIRFIRDHLGLTGEEFADFLGVRPSQLSRWENGHEPIGVANDRAVRLLEDKMDTGKLDLQLLRSITSETAEPLRLRARLEGGEWVVTEVSRLNPNRASASGLTTR